MAQRTGVETMDTPAACRTYNILASEGRHVLAALLIEKRLRAASHFGVKSRVANRRPASVSNDQSSSPTQRT